MHVATLIAKLALAAHLLVAPASGAVLPRGVPPTFVVKAGQPGDLLYLELSKSRRADMNGVFTDRAWSMSYEARPAGKRTRITPRRSRIWTKAGSYYWHVYRVDCPFTGPRPHTCTERAITRARRFTITSATTRAN